MATDKEMELAKQILAKLTEMEEKVTKIEDSLDRVDNKMGNLNGEASKSVESNLDDLKNVQKELQATFTKGFADVHKGLAEIKEKNKNRKTAKEIIEGIAGNGEKKSGKQVH
ncbi:chromosome segregation protein SMC [Bacillus toyonensis]|uniref:chromosome segregation protein SMC n=1 Tax=Bacillus toyonensis TaxID=155322 RepID=UPI000BED0F1C|nr:chromosome segregation protein SMC [Bacillus toyonensis]PEC65625.1 chromosome segregation protein SMC [Bacillus toyonensis]